MLCRETRVLCTHIAVSFEYVTLSGGTLYLKYCFETLPYHALSLFPFSFSFSSSPIKHCLVVCFHTSVLRMPVFTMVFFLSVSERRLSVMSRKKNCKNQLDIHFSSSHLMLIYCTSVDVMLYGFCSYPSEMYSQLDRIEKPKVFILVSTCMTWARTGALEPVGGFSCLSFFVFFFIIKNLADYLGDRAFLNLGLA